MWHLLGTHCRTHGATRLLVVEDLDGTVPLEQIDDVIAAMADAGFGAIRTAFVELQDDLQGSEHGLDPRQRARRECLRDRTTSSSRATG